ncbi:MAG: hypothetical protein ACLTG4_05885 [Oscillospiraceae bacterium]
MCSTRSSVDDIPYFRDLLQRGYYSREDMNQIASWGYYEDERKCVQPVLYPAEKTICGYPFLVRSYKNHGAAYCFIGCFRCAADAARHLALHLPDAGAGKLL